MKANKLALAIAAATTLFALPAAAHEQGSIVIRSGLATVQPDDSSTNVFLDGASLGDLATGVSVGNDTQLGLTATYMVTDNIGINLLAATPFSHDLKLAGGLTGVLGSVDLGETKHLPPTLTAQYYFGDASSKLRPYVGAGINYTVFFEDDFSKGYTDAGFTNLNLKNSWGLALQAGVDYQLSENLTLNAEVYKLDIDTTATFDLTNAGLNINNARGSVDVDIDPVVFAVTLGYTF